MKELLGWLGGGLALALSWFFSWWRIRNLKAQNKKFSQEADFEKIAKEKKGEEYEALSSVDKKSDEEVFSSWNKKNEDR